MRTIRELREEELDEFVRISAEAYPGIKLNSNEERQRFRERTQQRLAYPDMTLWGLFEAEEMLGIMRLYDFNMKLRSTRILIGGVGAVAVELRHKKEKAHSLIHHRLWLATGRMANYVVILPSALRRVHISTF